MATSASMVGRTLGHYRIEESIGAGAMGEVFRAHDTHLRRDVALKVLPPHSFADDSARRRFRKEAEALSRISHSNIATIFDFDSQDGVDFLVMEYVSGPLLTEVLNGRPPEKEVLRVGRELARGLAAAHREGVLHRDLKPANVRLTADGTVKVLDFGLAKLLRVDAESATLSVTAPQMLAGTPAYMAPEQFLHSALDARTDIYAVGVLLYQLTTGELPFASESFVGLADKVLHETPARPRAINPKVSAKLETIIARCMEKDPAKRFASAEELLSDLEKAEGGSTPRTGAWRRVLWTVALLLALAAVQAAWHWWASRPVATHTIRSIAVLPLRNLSNDASQDYFADGITEELITQLTKVGSLRVISRTSAMRFKNSTMLLPEIARELQVDAVIEGSVMRSGDRLRIHAQLLDASDTHLWAESYDRDIRDVFALSAEVTQTIAEQVRARLTPEEKARVSEHRPLMNGAYDAYLQGVFLAHRGEHAAAVPYLQLAVERDPTFLEAWYQLTEAKAMIRFENAEKIDASASAAGAKVLELAPQSAQAFIVRGDRAFYGNWDWSACDREFRQAVEIDPKSLDALEHYALCLSAMGDQDRALEMSERAKNLDPLSPLWWQREGRIFEARGEMAQAIARYRRAAELDPGSTTNYALLCRAFERRGSEAEGLAPCMKEIDVSAGSAEQKAAERATLQRQGIAAFRRQHALAELKGKKKEKDPSPTALAALYATAGNKDEALRWLEVAYERRVSNLAWVKTSSVWRPLHGDARYEDLLRRMKFPTR